MCYSQQAAWGRGDRLIQAALAALQRHVAPHDRGVCARVCVLRLGCAEQDLLPFTADKEAICLRSVDDRIAAYPHASVLAEITVAPCLVSFCSSCRACHA